MEGRCATASRKVDPPFIDTSARTRVRTTRLRRRTSSASLARVGDQPGSSIDEETTVPERSVTIASKVGLHARPAAIFVKAASEQPASVTIVKAGSGVDPVDASSILGIMTLGAEFGDEVILTSDGEGAEEALDALAALLAKDLDAEEV
jgi:phosphocarrier protein HPr